MKLAVSKQSHYTSTGLKLFRSNYCFQIFQSSTIRIKHKGFSLKAPEKKNKSFDSKLESFGARELSTYNALETS